MGLRFRRPIVGDLAELTSGLAFLGYAVLAPKAAAAISAWNVIRGRGADLSAISLSMFFGTLAAMQLVTCLAHAPLLRLAAIYASIVVWIGVLVGMVWMGMWVALCPIGAILVSLILRYLALPMQHPPQPKSGSVPVWRP